MMADLYSVFHEALEKLAAGEAEAARTLMGEPYKQAYAEADEATKEAAKKLHEQMHNALKPEAKNHIAPLARQTLEAMQQVEATKEAVEAGQRLLNASAPVSWQTFAFQRAHKGLHDAMHVIDHTRAEQATALTKQEAALYEEKGALGYAKSLIARRWGKGNEAAAATLDHSSHDHGHCDGHDHHHSHDEHHHEHAAKTAAKEETALGAAALEEYAGIRHLNTTGRKLAVGAGATAGLGLVVHGGYNTAKALRGESREDNALHPAAKEREGTNWMRLVVGIGEMAAGAAVAYRMLTGRWGMRGPVKGVADPIMECRHGHGH